MATSAKSESSTQTRLLDAAEALIAVQGIAATSLRQITEEAEVNLSLVKYHFGSKEGLVDAMLKRRMDPINDQRIVLLKELERRIPKGELPVEDVLEALIRPVVELCLCSGKEGIRFLRVFSRIFSEPAASMRMMHKQMGPMMKNFNAAFDRALPATKPKDRIWRHMASLGAVQNTLLMLSMVDELPPMIRVPVRVVQGKPDHEQVLARLVAFCAAGMRAEVSDLR